MEGEDTARGDTRARHGLSAEEQQRFARDGYLVRRSAFTAPEVEALGAAFDRLAARAEGLRDTVELDGATFVMGPTGPGGAPRIQRVVWCGAAEPALMAASLDPRVLVPALELLGEAAADQIVNQAHLKAPGDGVAFPLHQDAWNRRVGTALWRDASADGGFVQALLTIDPMVPENGPLVVLPGSHREGPIVGLERRARLEALAAARPPVVLEAPPGSLVFFGPFLVHGSAPNAGTLGRRALVNGFARPGVNRRIYPGAGLGARRSPGFPVGQGQAGM